MITRRSFIGTAAAVVGAAAIGIPGSEVRYQASELTMRIFGNHVTTADVILCGNEDSGLFKLWVRKPGNQIKVDVPLSDVKKASFSGSFVQSRIQATDPDGNKAASDVFFRAVGSFFEVHFIEPGKSAPVWLPLEHIRAVVV